MRLTLRCICGILVTLENGLDEFNADAPQKYVAQLVIVRKAIRDSRRILHDILDNMIDSNER